MKRVDLLRDIVALLTTVTRDLEPWIEDTVCDNLSNVQELVQELSVFFEHSKQCERLKLKLMVKVLNEDAASYHELQELQSLLVDCLLDKLPHLLEHATVAVFDLFSNCPKIRSVLQCRQNESSRLFYNTAIQYLSSPNLNLYKGAVRVLAEGCMSKGSHNVDVLYAVPQQYRPNVLAAIPNQEVAVALFKEFYPSSDIIQTCQLFSETQMKIISPLVVQCLSGAELESTHLRLLALPHTLSVQSLLFSIGTVLGIKACVRNIQYFANTRCLKAGVLGDCVEQLEGCWNKEARETSSEFVESIISALFHNTPNKDDNYITEALLSDCTPTKQYKHVLRLLKSLASLEVLEPLLELRSGVCPHSLPGDAMCGSWQECLLLSLTTYYTESTPERFSLGVQFFAALCKYGTKSSSASSESEKDTSGSTIVGTQVFRSFIEKMLGRMDCIEPVLQIFLALDFERTDDSCDVVNEQPVRCYVIESVLRTFCVSECDMYTRVSIMEYLQKVCLTGYIRDDSYEMTDCFFTAVSEMLVVVKDEDSMVHIAFFSMLKAQRLVFEKLLHKTILTGPCTLEAMEGVESPSNSTPRVNGAGGKDVDSIIANLVDAAEVEDAVIIRARNERVAKAHYVESTNDEQCYTQMGISDQQYEALFASLLKFITEDRCDIERLHAGAELLLTILSPVRTDLEHLTTLLRPYLGLLSSEHSPLLISVKEMFSELMEDGKLPYVDFTNVSSVSSECTRVDNDEDLHTVLTLLKADPDPDLVCDCY